MINHSKPGRDGTARAGIRRSGYPFLRAVSPHDAVNGARQAGDEWGVIGKNLPRLSRPYNHIFIILGVLTLLLNTTRWANAHGGGTLQVSNVPVGDCQVSVWSAPPNARANSPLHVTVGVANTADGTPILDALVQVDVSEAVGGTAVIQTTATTEQSVNKLFYEADIPRLNPGSYNFAVTTTCNEVTETVSFMVTVRPSTNPLLLTLPLAAGGLMFAILLYRSWHRKEIRRLRD